MWMVISLEMDIKTLLPFDLLFVNTLGTENGMFA